MFRGYNNNNVTVILEGARGPMQCAPQETFDHSDLVCVKNHLSCHLFLACRLWQT